VSVDLDLFPGTCTIATRTGATYDADTGDSGETYAVAVAVACLKAAPSESWSRSWPNVDKLKRATFYLPAETTVAQRAKLTYGGDVYLVLDVQAYEDLPELNSIAALCECIEGVTA